MHCAKSSSSMNLIFLVYKRLLIVKWKICMLCFLIINISGWAEMMAKREENTPLYFITRPGLNFYGQVHSGYRIKIPKRPIRDGMRHFHESVPGVYSKIVKTDAPSSS